MDKTPLLQEMLVNDQIRVYKTRAGWCYLARQGDGGKILGYEGEEKSIERSLRKKEQARSLKAADDRIAAAERAGRPWAGV